MFGTRPLADRRTKEKTGRQLHCSHRPVETRRDPPAPGGAPTPVKNAAAGERSRQIFALSVR